MQGILVHVLVPKTPPGALAGTLSVQPFFVLCGTSKIVFAIYKVEASSPIA